MRKLDIFTAYWTIVALLCNLFLPTQFYLSILLVTDIALLCWGMMLERNRWLFEEWLFRLKLWIEKRPEKWTR